MDPSVLEAQSKSEAVVQLTVALRESNVPHLRWSQAPPCLGQGEAGSADINSCFQSLFLCLFFIGIFNG